MSTQTCPIRTERRALLALPKPLLLAALALVMTVGCGKKTAVDKPSQKKAEADADPISATNENAATSAPSAVAPKLYSDATSQNRFETIFKMYARAFAVPQPGNLIRAEFKDGRLVVGALLYYTAKGAVVNTPDGPLPFDVSELTEESRREIFATDFSQHMARQQVDRESAGSARVDMDSLFFPRSDLPVLQPRKLIADRMKPRYGPSRLYASVDEPELFRGDNVFVIEESNSWVAVKTSADAPRVAGWIPKYASFMSNPENKEAVANEVELLLSNGFLISIDPKKNEAHIDSYKWRTADSASVEGLSRLLSFYCGQQKGVRLFWVDIRDAGSGQRLASYSESKGFKAY